jgi:hypothetical protein
MEKAQNLLLKLYDEKKANYIEPTLPPEFQNVDDRRLNYNNDTGGEPIDNDLNLSEESNIEQDMIIGEEVAEEENAEANDSNREQNLSSYKSKELTGNDFEKLESISFSIKHINDRYHVWKNFDEAQVLEMMPKNFELSNDQTHALNKILTCKHTHQLDFNLEFYFSTSEDTNVRSFFKRFFNNKNSSQASSSSYKEHNSEFSGDFLPKIKQTYNNLLTLDNLKSLCQFDKKFLDLIYEKTHSKRPYTCYISLPSVIAALNNKTDCNYLTQNDLDNFLYMMDKCYDLQKNGILYAIASETKPKEPIFELMDKNNVRTLFAQRDDVKNNLCFKNNILHIVYDHLVDKDFLNNYSDFKAKKLNDFEFDVKMSTLILFNTDSSSQIDTGDTRLYKEQFVYELYLNHYYHKEYKDDHTQLLGKKIISVFKI